MAEFWARRVGNALVPDGAESTAEFARISPTKPILVTAKAPRHGPHHRLYWVLCARIGTAIGQPAEVVSDILKVATGHCYTVKLKSAGWQRYPKSISFAAMDQTEFSKFFEDCVRVIYEEFGIARPEVLEAIGDILTPQEAHLRDKEGNLK